MEIFKICICSWQVQAFLVTHLVKNLPGMQETQVQSLRVVGVGKISWRREWQPTPVFLPGESWRGAWRATTVHGVAKNWHRRWLWQVHWPSNNTGLKCTGPCPGQDHTVCGWLNLWMGNCRCWGMSLKLYMDFQFHGGLVLLISTLFKGQP